MYLTYTCNCCGRMIPGMEKKYGCRNCWKAGKHEGTYCSEQCLNSHKIKSGEVMKAGDKAIVQKSNLIDACLAGTTVTILEVSEKELPLGNFSVSVRYEDNGLDGMEGFLPSSCLEVQSEDQQT